MNRGDPIPTRCPKCGGHDLVLLEEFVVYDVVHVQGGRLDDRSVADYPSLTGVVLGECERKNCKHRWRLRKSPFMERAA